MKITRQKKAHRYLSFFRNNYGFRQPFQVLIDGTFCHAALANKINIKEQLTKYLEGDVKLLTTACVVTETETLGPKLFGVLSIVKQFGTHKCGHEKKPGSAAECLLSMIGNSNANHYFVATQDTELRKKLRKIAGTPLLYIDYNSPLLEKPSKMSSDVADNINDKKLNPNDYEHEILKKLKKEAFGEEKEVKKRKRKRPAGPNPLSCKKKKKKPNPPPEKKNDSRDEKKKKRKKRKKTKANAIVCDTTANVVNSAT